MIETTQKTFLNAAFIILGVYFAITGLIQAQQFLMPLVVAGLLAMLMLPFSRMLEKWRVPRTVAGLICITLLLALAIGINVLVIKQVQNFSKSLPQMIESQQPRIERLNNYLSEKTGLSPWKQKEQFMSILEEKMGQIGSNALILISNVQDFMMATLLVFVYTYFLMLYRERFSGFVLLFIPEEKRSEAKEVIRNCSKIAQKYLLGRLILILFLALIYFAGFTAAGLKQALFISLLVAVLSLIPYLGNFVGLFLAISIGLLSGFRTGQILEILIIFGVAQLIESYVLEPYVVGPQVELNAVISIISIVMGGVIWGVVGVVIALPVVGIVKVICDHVPALHPFAFLLGADRSSTMDKLSAFKKKWARRPAHHLF